MPAVYRGLSSEIEALLGRAPTERELQQLDWLRRELQGWNERFNLTSITDTVEIEIKHFLDSLTCLPLMRKQDSLVDIGTGAGFPGIPLKLFEPTLQMTLLEATAKKVRFCQHVIEGLKLVQVEAVHARAEDIGQDPTHRGRYDRAVARAVAPLAVLAEYSLPMLKLGGLMVAMKGESGPAEAQVAEPVLTQLGGRLDHIQTVELPTVADERYLVVIEKVETTSPAYPRRPGIPAKRPLTDQSSNG